MNDRRKPSPSDELLGRAKGESSGDDSFDAYAASSPADEYEPPAPMHSSTIGELDHSLDLGEDMSAEEIAAALSESRAPEPPAETERVPDTASIPDWARTEPDPDASPPPAVDPSQGPAQRPADMITSSDSGASPSGPAQADDDDLWAGGDRWSEPTTQWEQYEARRAERRQSRFDIPVPRVGLRTLLSFGLALVFLFGGAVWNYFDGREPVSSIAVGDCFIVGEALEIDQVPVVDCERKHDSELFAKVDMAGMGSAYPGDETMFDWLFERCLEQFPSYVGEPYETSEYWIDMFIPLEDAWREGDTSGLCTLILVDDDLNVRTVAGSGRNSGANA